MKADDQDGGEPGPPTVFDAERFSARLRAQMAADKVGIKELAQRSGLSYGMVQQLRRGKPSRNARVQRGQTELSPAFVSIAKIAYGLDLDFCYVASWALPTVEEGRWRNFTHFERAWIAAKIDADPAALDERLRAVTDPDGVSRKDA